MADGPPGFAARGNTGYFFVGVILMLATQMKIAPGSVISTAEAECGESDMALRAVETALEMFRQAGNDLKALQSAADELDRAVHRIRCWVNSDFLPSPEGGGSSRSDSINGRKGMV